MIKWYFLGISLFFVVVVVQSSPHSLSSLYNTRENGAYGIGNSQQPSKVAKSEGENSCEKSSVVNHRDGTQTINVRFPKIEVTQNDQYMCTSYPVPFNDELSYLTSFTPHASASSSHHMLVYGCSKPFSTQPSWNCPSMGKICGSGGSQIIYAWAKNAPPLTLPPNIGVRVGGNTTVHYMVIQMHYSHKLPTGQLDCSGFSATATTEPQQYYAGIFLVGANRITIPPHSDLSSTDVGCTYRRPATLEVFGFRTHAHSLATVITGYRVRNGETKMIGKGNPQWPHAFYPRIGGSVDVQPGDEVVARCNYKSDRSTYTYAGMRGDDEMCNFYMMYYTDNSAKASSTLECWGMHSYVEFPKDANDLAPYPGFAGEDSVEAIQNGLAETPPIPSAHTHNHHQVEVEQPEIVEENSDDILPIVDLKGILNWPQPSTTNVLGQVGGVATDNQGFVHVFHRAYRSWDGSSFDHNNYFTSPNNPITSNTIYKYDPNDGTLVNSWGAGLFFMPHGITIDSENNVWVTDVALHQVLKFPLDGSSTALLTLGERLVPGSDNQHFCKPTDVAVEKDGTFYIADGYCNGRVLKYSPSGELITTWGKKEPDYFWGVPNLGVFQIVHSITLCRNEQDVCVADRQNGRIQCFDKSGKFLKVIENKKKMGPYVYAMECTDTNGGLMYAVNGESVSTRTSGYTIDYKKGEVIGQWELSDTVSLSYPHDVTVSNDGSRVYVGQLDPHRVYQFKVNAPSSVEIQDETPADPQVVVEEESDEVQQQPAGLLVESVKKSDLNLDEVTTNNDDSSAKSQTGEGSVLVAVILVLLTIPVIALIISLLYVRVRSRRLSNHEGMLGCDIYENKSQERQPLFKPNLGFSSLFKKSSSAEKQGFERVNTEDLDDVGNVTESEDESPSKLPSQN